MKIYEYHAFPNPRRVRIFLAEKGITGIDFEQIDVPEGEHRNDNYLAKNPYAGVPILEFDDGTCLSETVAISRYFEERYPGPKLMGETPEEKALIEMWQRRVESSIFEAVATYYHQGTEGFGDLEPYQYKDWGKKNRDLAIAGMRKLDQHLEGRTFIAGDEFSIADITALCAVDYAAFVEIAVPDDLTYLKRWYDAVSSRPSAAA